MLPLYMLCAIKGKTAGIQLFTWMPCKACPSVKLCTVMAMQEATVASECHLWLSM